MPHSYSRRSSSASSSSSSSSTQSNVSIESFNVNVPRKNIVKPLIWFAGGDPRRHTNLRRQVTTIEEPNGPTRTVERYLLVRDPSGYTMWFYEDDYDGRSHHSSSSSRSSRSGRSSRHSSRTQPAAGGVPVRPHPPPPQHPQHMGGAGPWMPPQGGGGGMGMGMGMGMGPPPMMMGGGGGPPPGAPIEIVDGMNPNDDDDDYSSVYSGSSYMTGSVHQAPHQPPMFMPPGPGPMQMPPMMHQQQHQPPPPPPPPQGNPLGEGGAGFIQLNP
ncbi:hypothetical protein M406DRAFT_357694 [Cryphonectria parasitica EP155]|uniref:Uncharacterized protein n=1 Tax=Cryphonectria parasitica (strain ATCC 38755 / EP155) TaxID=660469 RepID=A0A9P4XU45_CRYP1|nr:uncharacterized protein M406DRAFT_357694 [Cryphonectria parasitica EP155]KAF3761334.1 hypothetical protein M406DRAFT_357694 [Cryphonectria parasitica EP155]